MKVALAFVAALSLAACVDEPTDPAAGLYGAGIGKAFQTDPTQLVPATYVANEKFNGHDPNEFDQLVQEANRIEEFTGTDWDAVCGEPCKVIGLHMNSGDTFAYRDDGRFLGVVPANVDATRDNPFTGVVPGKANAKL